VPALILPPKPSCVRQRMATRCFWSPVRTRANATLYDKLSYNFIRDIAPVASISRETFALEVNPSFPAKTIPEFIVHAKANPGKLSMASPGSGTVPHMVGELFKMMAGVDLVHVPYRGSAPALTDLMGGQGARDVLALVDPICQGWQAACARGIKRVAFGCAARHSNCGRFPAGLRGDRLVFANVRGQPLFLPNTRAAPMRSTACRARPRRPLQAFPDG